MDHNVEDNMVNEDDVDEEDEEIGDLPEYSVEELAKLKDMNEAGQAREILIEQRTIPNVAEIVSIANKDRRAISIEECVVGGALISTVGIDLSVDESCFSDKVQLKNGVFSGRLSFWDVSFEKGIDFEGAVFEEEVIFEDCTFSGKVNFAGAVFEKQAGFVACDFEEETYFDNARCKGEVDFSQSSFRNRVSYKGCLFDKSVDLYDVSFAESPDTTDSNLQDTKKESRKSHATASRGPGKKVKRKTEFNPWRELDRVSKKSLSRREIIRGIFRFLPGDKEK